MPFILGHYQPRPKLRAHLGTRTTAAVSLVSKTLRVIRGASVLTIRGRSTSKVASQFLDYGLRTLLVCVQEARPSLASFSKRRRNRPFLAFFCAKPRNLSATSLAREFRIKNRAKSLAISPVSIRPPFEVGWQMPGDSVARSYAVSLAPTPPNQDRIRPSNGIRESRRNACWPEAGSRSESVPE
jgi:hypothetical protein